MKEILKIWCQIFILMKKMIILRNVQFQPDRKKTLVIWAMRKKLNKFTLLLPIYYILEQDISIGADAGIAKTDRAK